MFLHNFYMFQHNFKYFCIFLTCLLFFSTRVRVYIEVLMLDVIKMSRKIIKTAEEEMLSAAVQEFPCLCDKSLKSYKEKDTNANAWEAVASKLDFVENG